MFERILFGSLRFSANWFFHCPVNCWFKYYSSSSVSGRIYNSSPNPRIQTMPFIFTHIGISCLIVMDIISMFFSYFPLFSEADSSQGGPQDVTWSPATRAKFAEVLTYDYMSEEDTDPTHPSGNALSYPLLGKAPNCA